MPTREALYEQEQQRRAGKKRRDQSLRQELVDQQYVSRRDAIVDADVARMLADVDEQMLADLLASAGEQDGPIECASRE